MSLVAINWSDFFLGDMSQESGKYRMPTELNLFKGWIWQDNHGLFTNCSGFQFALCWRSTIVSVLQISTTAVLFCLAIGGFNDGFLSGYDDPIDHVWLLGLHYFFSSLKAFTALSASHCSFIFRDSTEYLLRTRSKTAMLRSTVLLATMSNHITSSS